MPSLHSSHVCLVVAEGALMNSPAPQDGWTMHSLNLCSSSSRYSSFAQGAQFKSVYALPGLLTRSPGPHTDISSHTSAFSRGWNSVSPSHVEQTRSDEYVCCLDTYWPRRHVVRAWQIRFLIAVGACVSNCVLLSHLTFEPHVRSLVAVGFLS